MIIRMLSISGNMLEAAVTVSLVYVRVPEVGVLNSFLRVQLIYFHLRRFILIFFLPMIESFLKMSFLYISGKQTLFKIDITESQITDSQITVSQILLRSSLQVHHKGVVLLKLI